MDFIRAHHLDAFTALDTAALRRDYLVAGLFNRGHVELRHWDVDRTVLGGVVPEISGLELAAPAELRTGYFCERREIGVINLGAPGAIETDGTRHALGHLDALYIGRGTRAVRFYSDNPDQPAQFYLVSYGAHTAHPVKLVRFAEAQVTVLGTPENASRRRLCKLLVPGVVDTCQVVLGLTQVETGGAWNSMPCHTHERRSEIYLYYNLPPNQVVMHFLGRPRETRHLVMRDREAALSPGWSIHTGAGTGAYSFVWCMGGENQEFTDMDAVAMEDLR